MEQVIPYDLLVNSTQIKSFKEHALKLIDYELVPLVGFQLPSSERVTHCVEQTVAKAVVHSYAGNLFGLVMFLTLIDRII